MIEEAKENQITEKHHKRYLWWILGFFLVIIISIGYYLSTQTLIIKNNSKWTMTWGEIKVNSVIIPSSKDINIIKKELTDTWRFKIAKDGKSLEGAVAIDFSQSKWELVQTIVQKSSENEGKEQIKIHFWEWIVIKSQWKNFTWVINKPRYLSNDEIKSLSGGEQIINTVVSLWDEKNHINFEDGSGKQQEVEVEVGLSKWYLLWSEITIKYSQDQKNWEDFNKTKVIDIGNGEIWVRFTTNHFSRYRFTPYTAINEISPIDWSISKTASMSFTWDIQTTHPSAWMTQICLDSSCRYRSTLNKPTWSYTELIYPVSNGNHTWRATVTNGEGSYMPWPLISFTVQAPDIPTQILPTNWATVTTVTPIVSRSPVSSVWFVGTISYNLFVYNDGYCGTVYLAAGGGLKTTTSTTLAALPPWAYSRKLYAQDQNTPVGNVWAFSPCRTFTVSPDTTPPTTTITYPSAWGYKSSDFYITFSDTDDIWFWSCRYSIYNWSTNTLPYTSRTCNGSFRIPQMTYCPQNGINNCIIYWYSQDTAGNTSQTTSISLGIDTIDPVTTITSPANWSCLTWTSNITFSDIDTWAWLSLYWCAVDIFNNGVQAQYIWRNCNSTISFVTANYCPTEWINTCVIQWYSFSNTSPWNSMSRYVTGTYSVDRTWPTPPTTLSASNTNTSTPTLSRSAAADNDSCNTNSIGYTGEIFQNGSCTTRIQDIPYRGTQSYTVSPWLANWSYSYKIMALDHRWNQGSRSACQSFVVNTDTTEPTTTISPDGATCTGSNPSVSLSCTDVGGVWCLSSEYQVIAAVGTCGTLSTYTSAFAVPWSAGAYTQSKVCYRSTDNANNIETTKTSNIYYIDKAPPTNTTLSSPSNSSTVATLTPTLTWNTVSEIGCSTVLYDRQLCSDAACSTVLQSASSITATSVSLTTLTNGSTYYRRAKSKDTLWNTNTWTSTYSFTVSTSVNMPTCTPSGWAFCTSQAVSCSSSLPIKYTTDGITTPTCSSSAWSNQSFSSTTTLKVISCDNGVASAANTYTYIKDTTVPSISVSNGIVQETNACNITITSVTDGWIGWPQYSCDGTNYYSWTSSVNCSQWIFNEPWTKSWSGRAKDACWNITSTSASCTRTNLAPIANNISVYANNWANLTLTADATDPGGWGTPFTYQWYTNNACTTAIVWATNSTYTTGVFQICPTNIVYGYKATDIQWSGSNCASATATWVNTAPAVSNGSTSGPEWSQLMIIANTSDTCWITSYQRYNGITCTTPIVWEINWRYMAPAQNGSISIGYSFKAYDGTSRSNCAVSTGTWTNQAPNIPTLIIPPNGTRATSRQFCATVSDSWGGNLSARFVIGWTTYVWSTVASNNNSCYTYTSDLCSATIRYAYAVDTNSATSTNTTSWNARIDSVIPTTNLTLPTAWTTQTPPFAVSFSDTDSCSSTNTCWYYVYSWSIKTLTDTQRVCNTPISITTANCWAAWTNNCTVYGYSIDNAWNVSTTNSRTYSITYDTTAPTFTFASASGPECIVGSLTITSATDGWWVGLHATPYSFDGTTWWVTTSISIPAQQTWIVVKTGWVRDALNNIRSIWATYTFTDAPPTANDFTFWTNIGNTGRTADWLTLSNATEGSCWTSSLSFSGIITNGAKWICSQVWTTGIKYIPNASKNGSDTCTIQIKDNENSTKNITITRTGIYTMPVVWPIFTNFLNGIANPIKGNPIIANRWSEINNFMNMRKLDVTSILPSGNLYINGNLQLTWWATSCSNGNRGEMKLSGTCFLGCTPSWRESLNKLCSY